MYNFQQLFVVTNPATYMFVKVRLTELEAVSIPTGHLLRCFDDFLAAGSGMDVGVVGPNERAQAPA